MKKSKGNGFVRLIKWEFGSTEKMYSTELAIGKLLFKKGQYAEWMFSIVGLGLTKYEREIMNRKFMSFSGHITIYLGKLIISYNREGYRDTLRNVDITYDRALKEIAEEQARTLKYKLKDKYKGFKDWINHLQFREQYEFTMYRAYEGKYTFIADMLSAFQFAANYEGDLYYKGQLIFSGLCWNYEEMAASVRKHLGERFVGKHGLKLGSYKDPWSKQIKRCENNNRKFA